MIHLLLWALMLSTSIQASPPVTPKPGNELLLHDLLTQYRTEATAWLNGLKSTLSQSAGASENGPAPAHFSEMDRIQNEMTHYQWSAIDVPGVTLSFLHELDLTHYSDMQLPDLLALTTTHDWFTSLTKRFDTTGDRHSKEFEVLIIVTQHLAKPSAHRPLDLRDESVAKTREALFRCYDSFNPAHGSDSAVSSCLDTGSMLGDRRAFRKASEALNIFLNPSPTETVRESVNAPTSEEPAFVLAAGQAIKDFIPTLAPELDSERKIILNRLLNSGKLSQTSAFVLAEDAEVN